jgi:hypothetical protein
LGLTVCSDFITYNELTGVGAVIPGRTWTGIAAMDSPVPEPLAVGLMAVGCLVLFGFRRYRARQ